MKSDGTPDPVWDTRPGRDNFRVLDDNFADTGKHGSFRHNDTVYFTDPKDQSVRIQGTVRPEHAFFISGSRYTLTGTGTIAGSGGIPFRGGELVIENANSYTGRTDLAAGTLTLGNDAALGAGLLAIEGGTLQPSGGVREVANAIDVGPLYQQEDPLEVTLAGSHQLRLTGPVRLRREAQVYVLNVTNSSKVTVEDQVTEQTGDTMVVKRGPGTLEVSGTTSHSGGTWTQEGELRLDAGIIRGRVTLADFEWLSGPKLTGFGTIGGDLGVIASGHVDPGLDNDTPGTFVVDGKLAMFDSRYSVDLHGPSRASDSIIVDGPSVSLGGALDVRLHLDPQVGDSFKIIDHRGNGATEGAFAGWPEGTSFTVRGPRGLFVTMTITYIGGDGNDVVLTALTREQLSAAPPPTSDPVPA